MKSSELIALAELVGLEIEIHTDYTIHTGKLISIISTQSGAAIRIGSGLSLQRKSGKTWARGCTEISAGPIRSVIPAEPRFVSRFGNAKRKEPANA